jgi:large subunit ribosomal protein L1
MARAGKRMSAIREQIEPGKAYSIDEALEILKSSSKVKFTESVDVAVFTQSENAEIATAAGADVVGMDDLHDQIKGGDLAFDVVIATPDAMRVVGKLGQLLGPRGLMPNPKVGTVTTDVETAVKNAKAGQVRYRTDKAGIVQGHVS